MTADPRSLDSPGWTVRVRAGGGGITYTSGRMTRQAAEELAATFAASVDLAAATTREFVEFPAAGDGTTRIRTERVSAIDVMPLQQARPNSWIGTETRPVITELETR